MKVAIAIPVLKLMHTRMVISLLGVQKALKERNHDVRVFFNATAQHDASRNQLSKEVTDWESDYVFWIDADVAFSQEKFEHFFDTVIKDDVDFASGIYPIRYPPFAPAVFLHDGEGRTEFVTYPDKPFEIGRCGFGMVLMKTGLLRTLYYLYDHMPFQFVKKSSGGMEGEDFFFCRAVNENGYKMWCYPDFLADYHDEVTPWHMRKYQEDRLKMVADLSEFTGQSIAQIYATCSIASDLVAGKWKATFGDTTPTEEQADAFYKNCPEYLYDLTWFWGGGTCRTKNAAIEQAKWKEPKAVLDFGCGIGDLCFAMEKACPGATVHGYDINAATSDYMKWRIAKHDYKTQVFVGGEFHWPENFYDVIFCMDVLEHMKNPLDYVRKIHKMLKPGGTLLAEVSPMKAGQPMHISGNVDICSCGFRRKNENEYEAMK